MTIPQGQRPHRPPRTALRGALALAAAGAAALSLAACTNFSAPSTPPAPPPPPTPKTPAERRAPNTSALPPASLPGWHRVFADDFSQPVPLGDFPEAVKDRWFAYSGGAKDTSKAGTYVPAKTVSIANGILNVHLHTEHGVHMVAALLPVVSGANGRNGGLLYGRYMIRIRADAVEGYKASMLLWPDSETWPRDGEIDYPEADLGGLIHAYLHFQGATSGGEQAGFVTAKTYQQWHTATLTWLPHFVQFQLDNQIVGTVTGSIPDTPMHAIIQIETRTIGAPPTNAAAGNVQLDWVSIYTPSCNPAMSITPAKAACTS